MIIGLYKVWPQILTFVPLVMDELARLIEDEDSKCILFDSDIVLTEETLYGKSEVLWNLKVICSFISWRSKDYSGVRDDRLSSCLKK